MLQNALAFLPVKIAPLCFGFKMMKLVCGFLPFCFFEVGKILVSTGRKESEVASKLLFKNT